MPRATTRDAAKRDLIEHYVYLAENASEVTADRFLVNAEGSFEDLAEQPMMGSPLMLRHPDLAGMRKWSVRDFDHFLIFYLPRPDGVSIVRVLHSSQEWWRVLGVKTE